MNRNSQPRESTLKQLTLAIIKPDAVAGKNVDRILTHLEQEGFEIVAARYLQLTYKDAAAFYEEHRGKPFYERLVTFMTSGPVLVAALARENAVDELRRVIGATDPAEAEEGTIRKLYAIDKTRNAIHAAESEAAAERELTFFFNPRELIDHKA